MAEIKVGDLVLVTTVGRVIFEFSDGTVIVEVPDETVARTRKALTPADQPRPIPTLWNWWTWW
jgi:hypothetical protein